MNKFLLSLISILCLVIIFLIFSLNKVDTGFISIKSSHNVKNTADQLEKILINKGMTVFARINHASAAEKIGKKLAPTELIIFGNPKVGTPLMQDNQSVAIDLPQKALIWEDKDGVVWFSYNTPKYLKKRHSLTRSDDLLKKIEGVLEIFSKAATSEL